MRLTFAAYWPLLLAPLLVLVWWTRRVSVAGLGRRHLQLATAIRACCIVFLILALMQPVVHLAGTAVSVAYLLDVSQSISPAAIEQSVAWIRKTNDAGKPADARFIAFAAQSKSFDSIEGMLQVAIDQSATDIASALENTLQGFAPGRLKRVVLFSDGNDNYGELAAVLPQLKRQQVEVFTIPLATRSTEDVWIESVLAPSRVNADEQFPLDVHVMSPKEMKASIEIRADKKLLTQRQVRLQKGVNRIAFETHVEASSGPLLLQAIVRPEADWIADNNTFSQPLIVLGKPRVLYAEGHSESAHYLKDALGMEGILVDTVDAAALPSKTEELGKYDAVILSDIDAKQLSETQMAALATYVRDLGGGFILAGGENVYGENGYSKSAIEEFLPVTFEVHKPRQNVSMVVILDKSGSMAGDKIRYAKEAAKAPVTLLKDTDHFGIITFNFNASWVLRPQPVVDRAAILKAIDDIGVGGETNLYPAMKEAYLELQKTSDEIKHVIILSDGRTLTDDFAAMTKQMADAHITLSTVAVGQEADRELLAKIAAWGKGKTYYAEDPAGVPQIFNEDVESSAGEALLETPFKPVVRKNVDVFKGIQFQSAPRLLGTIQVKAKPQAEVLLEAHKDQPLLARWQYGLGKSAVFASDVKDRWAADWLTWNGYAKFWSQLVRETMRREDASGFDFTAERNNGYAELSIQAMDPDGSYRDQLHVQVHEVAPDQTTRTFDVPQTGPGTYEMRVPLDAHGDYTFRASAGGEEGVSRVLPYSYPEEYRLYPPDIDKLKAISRQTDGVFQPAGPEIFASGGMSADERTALWPVLAAVSLILYFIEVLLRRFQLFENLD